MAAISCKNSSDLDSEGLHSCIACNPLHHLLYQSCNKSLITDNESTMTDSNLDALELTLDEREMEDLKVQSEAEEVNVAIAPTGATRDKLPQRPAVQSLVNRKKKKPVKCTLSKEPALRQMQAQIEELQQKALQMAAVQDSQERENQSLRKEVAVLKRQRLDSIGNSLSTASSYRSASGSASSTRGETRYPKDDSQEEAHLSNLCISGPDMPAELAAPEYTYS